MLKLFILLTFWFSSAYADLTLWKPASQNAYYVLPEGINPQTYFQNIQKYPSLAPFISFMQISPNDEVIRLKPQDPSSIQRALLVANSFDDHSSTHKRANLFGKHFSETFIFPVGAALGLNKKSEEKFYQELSQHFNLFVFMGGDDKHPGLYGERNRYSVHLNRFRDVLEQKLIRYIFYKTNRKIFGVCRGLQNVFTALGGKLIQDIPIELKVSEAHNGGVFHPVVFSKTAHNNIQEFSRDLPQVQILSHHHQAIREDSVTGTPFEVAARSPEGVVEAVESRDNRVVLVQYHPEMGQNNSEYSVRFFQRLRAWVGKPATHFCHKLF